MARKIKVELKADPKAYFFQGHAHYWALYDHAAGSKNMYTLLLFTAEDPVTIGRELPLSMCKDIVRKYEKFFDDHTCYGSRKSALHAKNFMRGK